MNPAGVNESMDVPPDGGEDSTQFLKERDRVFE